MELVEATEEDLEEVVALANLAYRGDTTGWATEAGTIAGTRLTLEQLQADLEAKPNAYLLLWREETGELLGTVWLEANNIGAWYLGLLTVRPGAQNRGLGRKLLEAAEAFALQRGAKRMRMTVLNVRTALIAWYERRGYATTAETRAFPYGDERFGTPLRDDLEFLVLEKQLLPPPPTKS